MDIERKYKLRFAFLPTNLFPIYNKGHENKWIWLRFYYKVYEWKQHTWAVYNPKGYSWSWVGYTNSK